MPANRTYSADNPVGYEIVLTREIDAPRALVFTAWSDEHHVKQWWGPAGFDNPVCKVDLRVGGKMDIHMRGPDGTTYPMTATFVEIVPEEKIVFTSGALDEKGGVLFEILHTVTFSDAGKKTLLALTARVLTARSEGAHHIGGMEEGWSGSLDKLVTYMEGNKNMNAPILTEGNTADREIVVSRVFEAPRQLVWEAMTNPAHITNWWGPRGFTTTMEKMDLRPGGIWKHVMHGPDGTDYPNESTFLDVVRPERIVYVHDGRKTGGPVAHFVAHWTFEALGEKQTRLTMRQVYETQEARDLIGKTYGAIEGAGQTFARLAEFLAAQKA